MGQAEQPRRGARVVARRDHLTGEVYKSHVKLTFARGAALRDPSGLFNSSLEGKVRRAIDVTEGEEIDEEAFKALIQEAVAVNQVDDRGR